MLFDFGVSLWVFVIGGGLVCVIVIFVGLFLLSESFVMRNKYMIDDNCELFVYGIFNFVVVFFGCFLVSVSVFRIVVNE